MIFKPPKASSNSWKDVGRYLDLGFRFALSITLGLLGGYWLDKKIHTLPLFLILGMFFGAFSGFLSIYHAAFPGKKKNEAVPDSKRKK